MALKHSRHSHKTLKEVHAHRHLQAAQANVVVRQLQDKNNREKNQASNPQGRPYLLCGDTDKGGITLSSDTEKLQWDAQVGYLFYFEHRGCSNCFVSDLKYVC